MKKTFAIIAILILVFSASNVIADTDLSGYTLDQLKAMRQQIDDEIEKRMSEDQGASEGALGDFYIQISGFSISKDYEGNPCLVVDYIWTNNSDDTESFIFTFSIKAFQNGIELEDGFMVDGCDLSSSMLDIRPGASLQVQSSFVLYDTQNPVELEVTELFSWSSDEMVTAIFNFQ